MMPISALSSICSSIYDCSARCEMASKSVGPSKTAFSLVGHIFGYTVFNKH